MPAGIQDSLRSAASGSRGSGVCCSTSSIQSGLHLDAESLYQMAKEKDPSSIASPSTAP